MRFYVKRIDIYVVRMYANAGPAAASKQNERKKKRKNDAHAH